MTDDIDEMNPLLPDDRTLGNPPEEPELRLSTYKKKPVVIEATQWHGGAAEATPIIDWILEGDSIASYDDAHIYELSPSGEEDKDEVDEAILIRTLEGTMVASSGDYIIKGVQGEFYPCKPDIFHETYRANVNDGTSFHDVENAFADADKNVISWEGDNFYRACGAPVNLDDEGAGSHCIKRVGHPSFYHEDYDGKLLRVEGLVDDEDEVDDGVLTEDDFVTSGGIDSMRNVDRREYEQKLVDPDEMNNRILEFGKDISYQSTREVKDKMAKHGFHFQPKV